MHLSLASTVLTEQDIAPQIASANVQGAVIDTQGWDGCMFEFNIGAMASGATFTAQIFNSANANMTGNTLVNSNSDAGVVTNAALSSVANGGNTNLYLIDVWRPNLRYLQDVAQPATANVTFGVTAIRYRRTGLLPPTQAALQLVQVQVN